MAGGPPNSSLYSSTGGIGMSDPRVPVRTRGPRPLSASSPAMNDGLAYSASGEVILGLGVKGQEMARRDERRVGWMVPPKPLIRTKSAVVAHFQVERQYAWRPMVSAQILGIAGIVVGVAFALLGVLLLVGSQGITTCTKYYGDPVNANMYHYDLTITPQDCGRPEGAARGLPLRIGPPFYVYYQLENFYQSDAQVLSSRNDRQLAGHVFEDAADLEKTCGNLTTTIVDGKKKILHPCGAMAGSVFTDSYHVRQDHNAEIVFDLDETPEAIAWDTDVKFRFKNPPPEVVEAKKDKIEFWMLNNVSSTIEEGLTYWKAGKGVENSHFIVWMRAAALPTFKKLYGKADGQLTVPFYVSATSRYPVLPFNGRKAVVISNMSIMGGPATFLGISYLTLGGIALIVGIWLLYTYVRSVRMEAAKERKGKESAGG